MHKCNECINPDNRSIRQQKWADQNESFVSHHSYLKVEGRGVAASVAARNCIACRNGGRIMETCRMLMQYKPSHRGQIAERVQKQREDWANYRLVSSMSMKATTLTKSANSLLLCNQCRRVWDLGSNRNVRDGSRASNIRSSTGGLASTYAPRRSTSPPLLKYIWWEAGPLINMSV